MASLRCERAVYKTDRQHEAMLLSSGNESCAPCMIPNDMRPDCMSARRHHPHHACWYPCNFRIIASPGSFARKYGPSYAGRKGLRDGLACLSSFDRLAMSRQGFIINNGFGPSAHLVDAAAPIVSTAAVAISSHSRSADSQTRGLRRGRGCASNFVRLRLHQAEPSSPRG